MQNSHDALRAWMEDTKRTTLEMAVLLQISQAHLSHLMNGGRSPSLALAARIEAATGIKATSWVQVRPVRVSA
jgi:transcriptional regulator with XRE-family HTH domain